MILEVAKVSANSVLVDGFPALVEVVRGSLDFVVLVEVCLAGKVMIAVSVVNVSCFQCSVKSEGGFHDSVEAGRVFLDFVEMVNGSLDFVATGRDSPGFGCGCVHCLKTGSGFVGSKWEGLCHVSERLGGHLAGSEVTVLL